MRKVILQLSIHSGIGPALIARLHRASNGAGLSNLKEMSVAEIASIHGMAQVKASLIKSALNHDAAYLAHESWCAANNVRAILLGDPEYPKLLAHIGAPPVAI